MSICWTSEPLPCLWPRDLLGLSPATGQEDLFLPQEAFWAFPLTPVKRPSGPLPCHWSAKRAAALPFSEAVLGPTIQKHRPGQYSYSGGHGVTLSRELSEQTFAPNVLSLCPGEERWLV